MSINTVDDMKFEDFVGNTQAVGQIKLLADDAAKNSGRLPHMGFFGAGFGATGGLILLGLVLLPGLRLSNPQGDGDSG